MITTIDTNTALILIDLQKGIVTGETVHPVKDILEKAAQLVAAFRAAEMPVVIVNVNTAGAAWTKTRKDADAPGSPSQKTEMAAEALEIVPEIITLEDDIFITKQTWNAFFDTNLHEELQNRDIKQIILAGISTSIGVEGTARNASEHGYNIAFATDAITDRIAAAHDNSINNIFPRLGELGTTAEIINQLKAVEVV